MAPASVSRLILTDGIDKYTTSAQRIALQRHTLKERTPHSRRENRPVVHFFFIDRGVVLIVLYHMRPVSRFLPYLKNTYWALMASSRFVYPVPVVIL